MQALGITWAGTRTERAAEMVRFLEQTLGLVRGDEEPGVTVFACPNGDVVEVFSADEPEHQHFTAPVVGFRVADVEAGRRELEEAGVALIGPVQRDGGTAWQHFRAPDGNVWEITGRDSEQS